MNLVCIIYLLHCYRNDMLWLIWIKMKYIRLFASTLWLQYLFTDKCLLSLWNFRSGASEGINKLDKHKWKTYTTWVCRFPRLYTKLLFLYRKECLNALKPIRFHSLFAVLSYSLRYIKPPTENMKQFYVFIRI